MKLETLCSNLLYEKGEKNADNDFIVLIDKIIKNKNEINILLNWIDKAPNIKIKQVQLLYTPTLDKN